MRRAENKKWKRKNNIEKPNYRCGSSDIHAVAGCTLTYFSRVSFLLFLCSFLLREI